MMMKLATCSINLILIAKNRHMPLRDGHDYARRLGIDGFASDVY
jgi:hypothetical protein